LLQWALPRLGLQWPGFKRVRRQVCRCIDARAKALRLADVPAYRAYLETHADEWPRLDACCLISISRFGRDRPVFEYLADTVLPELIAARRDDATLQAWSAGCASGEEPYTLLMYWKLRAAPRFPRATLHIVATDLDPNLLARARVARYTRSSVRELPDDWRTTAFRAEGRWLVLREPFRHDVDFALQDMRHEAPTGPFDLILCRNAAFTYFDLPLQCRTLERLLGALRPGGALVIGRRERLPPGAAGRAPWAPERGIHRTLRTQEA
jgi:chemotaxis protein methyltransferase CheR